MRSGETAEAAETFARVLSYDAHQRDALYNLAALAFNARDYAGAERWLQRGIASWPAHARMHARCSGSCISNAKTRRGRGRRWRLHFRSRPAILW
jgi:predicted Zn-dependent protease